MKIIVPMAGKGSRLRPHTLTVPKPLIPIAGKPIVQRLVEDIAKLSDEPIDEIAFIVGDFGFEVMESLREIAKNLGAKASIYTQDQPLGTAHALYCAKNSLRGKVVVAFADTLFKADFKLSTENDGVIWVKQVKDPSAFGVVDLDDTGHIKAFVEKPETFVSDLAIIGIYYFKEAEQLCKEVEYLINNDIKIRNEYQLTDALDRMNQQGSKFTLCKVDEWMDCGNKLVTVETNSKVLGFEKGNIELIDPSASIINSLIIEPCFIGKDVIIQNSKIGPNVSIGDRCIISESNIDTSLIQNDTRIDHGNLKNSMVGNFVKYYGRPQNLSLGDFSTFDSD